MYQIELGKSGLSVPTVAVGCMRINKLSKKELSAFIDTAMEKGANFFDHADIYGKKTCEALFGKVITLSLREKMILQTKCGIVSGKMFDFSYEHIVESVNNSLQNFGTDYIDVLLLDRRYKRTHLLIDIAFIHHYDIRCHLLDRCHNPGSQSLGE